MPKRKAVFLFLIATLLISSLTANADEPTSTTFKLGAPFTDGAILQRQISVPVWGWSKPGSQVSVEFAAQKKTAVADEEGKWQLKLDELCASLQPREMTVCSKDGEQIVLKDVLVGDVWLCAGQSNMAAKVRHNHVNQDPNDNLLESNFPAIRHICNPGGWHPATPEFVREFTRVGFCFARKVHQEQKVPIGLLNACVGGSRIESWMRVPPRDLPENTTGRSVSYGNLYHERVAPLAGYGIRGMLWYQGEANASEGHSYFLKMESLISDWRSTWKHGDIPFYLVQLAGISRSSTDSPAMGDGRARIREAQRRVLEIKNTGMAVAVDIGADKEHPANKVEVGIRLAHWALHHEYGQEEIVPSGPLYKGYKIEGDSIRISFDHAQGLMTATKTDYCPPIPVVGEKIPWLSIQDEDGEWHWADGEIEGADLIVSSNDVTKPVAVRYGFTNRPLGVYLYNAAGLPASPFTTEAEVDGK